MAEMAEIAEMSEYRTHAIILNTADQGEADRMVSFYTRDYGRLDAVAIGSRRIRAKLAGHLEPLTVSYVELAEKNRKIVTTAVELERFARTRRDFDRLEAALIFLERLRRLTLAPERDDRLWRFALTILNAIERAKSEELLLVSVYATFGLLTILGYAPSPSVRVKWPKAARDAYGRFLREHLTSLRRNPPPEPALRQFRQAITPLFVAVPSAIRRPVAVFF